MLHETEEQISVQLNEVFWLNEWAPVIGAEQGSSTLFQEPQGSREIGLAATPPDI